MWLKVLRNKTPIKLTKLYVSKPKAIVYATLTCTHMYICMYVHMYKSIYLAYAVGNKAHKTVVNCIEPKRWS